MSNRGYRTGAIDVIVVENGDGSMRFDNSYDLDGQVRSG